MAGYRYTSNSWGYYHCKNFITPESIARRICGLGFDGFDLFAGPESVPFLALEERAERYAGIRASCETGGGRISSLVLVGFDVADRGRASAQLGEALRIAPILGVTMVHLLPRKAGVTQETGFHNLSTSWTEHARAFADTGLRCTVENHACAPSADEDIFLVRSESDFVRVLEMTDGGIGVKFDPSWLLQLDATVDAAAALERLLPHAAVLDLKDWKAGKFVKPGTGLVDFAALARIIDRASIPTLSVEAEHHHGWSPLPVDFSPIDAVHRDDLAYYRGIFG